MTGLGPNSPLATSLIGCLKSCISEFDAPKDGSISDFRTDFFHSSHPLYISRTHITCQLNRRETKDL